MDNVLPDVYCEWLSKNVNGVHGELSGIYLYGEKELDERNETYECEKIMPSYFIIGDDSGDTVYVVRKNRDSREVYSIGMGDMNEENVLKVSGDFCVWVNKIDEINTDKNTDECSIYLIKKPKQLTDLLLLKKRLSLNMSIGYILKEIKKEKEVLLIPKINKYKLKKLIGDQEYLKGYLKIV